ncbi:hypothetical protein PRIPAC_85877 [Pristionchus pacificus]|uniref:Uncharacterized protein n=1 Tax=Pristionchus pacificus TaxID=54126 RepID=A0A2A6BSX5_PRIPA|nr:hypothetical protein PRIPAC_85877 [Pristionchus pacificus]|eukprot:PDM68916.1 hypothetical protein PRIPAC_47218 [Pristionchus pacificus]
MALPTTYVNGDTINPNMRRKIYIPKIFARIWAVIGLVGSSIVFLFLATAFENDSGRCDQPYYPIAPPTVLNP